MMNTEKTLLQNTKRALGASCLAVMVGCSSSSTSEGEVGSDTAFALNFTAQSAGSEISCDQQFDIFGATGSDSIGLGDLRFYVSELTFLDSDGDAIATTIDDSDFQLNHTAGSVALIDFLGKDGSSNDFCNAVQESTARTNTVITGSVARDDIASVEFEIGVPQALMQAVIQSGSAEDAPSPLNEMYWSWASGYRHLVANFTLMDATHTAYINNSAFHIGSRNCDTSATGKALTDQDTCEFINTAKVRIDNFDPAFDSINFDIAAAFSGLTLTDTVADVYAKVGSDTANGEVDVSLCLSPPNHHGYCVIGQDYGVQCHSGATQSACASLFPNYGLNLATGDADATTNSVFTKTM